MLKEIAELPQKGRIVRQIVKQNHRSNPRAHCQYVCKPSQAKAETCGLNSRPTKERRRKERRQRGIRYTKGKTAPHWCSQAQLHLRYLLLQAVPQMLHFCPQKPFIHFFALDFLMSLRWENSPKQKNILPGAAASKSLETLVVSSPRNFFHGVGAKAGCTDRYFCAAVGPWKHPITLGILKESDVRKWWELLTENRMRHSKVWVKLQGESRWQKRILDQQSKGSRQRRISTKTCEGDSRSSPGGHKLGGATRLQIGLGHGSSSSISMLLIRSAYSFQLGTMELWQDEQERKQAEEVESHVQA